MGDLHRDADALTSLHGRRNECAALDGLLARVRGGRSAVLVLRGEAGIGKTALLGYLTERAAGFSVARCMGVESEMELAFTGLHDLCAPMLSYLDALDEPQREALSVALGLASGEPPEMFLVALAALNLLAQAAEDPAAAVHRRRCAVAGSGHRSGARLRGAPTAGRAGGAGFCRPTDGGVGGSAGGSARSAVVRAG